MTTFSVTFGEQALTDIARATLTRALSNGDAMTLKINKRKTVENDVIRTAPPRLASVRIGEDTFGDFTLYGLNDSEPFSSIFYDWDLRRENNNDSLRLLLTRVLFGSALAPGDIGRLTGRTISLARASALTGNISTLIANAMMLSNRTQRGDLYKGLTRFRLGVSHIPLGGLHLSASVIALENPFDTAIEIKRYVADSLRVVYSPNNFPGDHGRRLIRAQYQGEDDMTTRFVSSGATPPAISLTDTLTSANEALAYIVLERGRLRDESVGFTVDVYDADIPLERFAPGQVVLLESRRAIITKVSQMLSEFDDIEAQQHTCRLSGFWLNPAISAVR